MIVRQMLKKIRIEESGDSDVLPGVSMDVLDFNEMNEDSSLQANSRQRANRSCSVSQRHPLQPIPSYPLHPSRRPTKVLTEAAINGKVDHPDRSERECYHR